MDHFLILEATNCVYLFSQLPVIFGGIITDFTTCFRDFETQFAFGSAAWVQLAVLYQNFSIVF